MNQGEGGVGRVARIRGRRKEGRESGEEGGGKPKQNFMSGGFKYSVSCKVYLLSPRCVNIRIDRYIREGVKKIYAFPK